MEDTQNFVSTLSEKLKPYEARIVKLEALEEAKQAKIDSLKSMIKDLHYLLEDLKADKQLNTKA